MRRPFTRHGDRIEVDLGLTEVQALTQVPALLAGAGDAGGRLDYQVHPDDPDAEQRYRDLVGDSLADLRRDDRDRFASLLRESEIAVEDAEAWMRVIGEARIVLAVALGIEHDGWEETADPTSSPEMALLGYLGFIQDSLVEALTADR